MKILLVRHGETVYNNSNIFSGRIDIGLSETGVKQAQIVSEYLYNNYKIDKIYSSPLMRAKNTITPLAKSLNLPVIELPEVVEIYGGEWENMSFSDMERLYPKEFKLWRENKGKSKCPNGEGFEEVGERAFKGLDRVARENMGKTIVVVCHAGVIRALVCMLKKYNFDKLRDINWIGNASFNEIEFDGKEYKFIREDVNDYLGELKTNFKSKI